MTSLGSDTRPAVRGAVMRLGEERLLHVERMGRIAYAPMFELQERRHQEVLEGRAADTLYLLEHDPVITLGKNTGLTGCGDNVLASEGELARLGVALLRSTRGGDVTYHGPGQIVGYPIVHLATPAERDVRGYVWKLEEILIRTCADYGVSAERIEGLRGVWVGADKIAAIGVRVARWTTMHGFALNVSTNLSHFELIVPCGIEGRGVTSLTRELGHHVPLAEVESRLIEHTSVVLGRKLG